MLSAFVFNSSASIVGIIMIIAVKNQNGSMIRTIMKVLAPIECTSMAINPAQISEGKAAEQRV
jgi:hypothetical protein